MAVDIVLIEVAGSALLEIQFSVTSGPYNRYEWYFGDGLTSAEANPRHVYTMPGTYRGRLIVYDGTSTYTDEAEFSVVVSDNMELALLDECYRCSVGKYEQGVGVSEFSGDYWVYAANAVGGVECRDAHNRPRNIIFDNNSGEWREIDSEVPYSDEAGYLAEYKDGYDADINVGYDIVCEVKFPKVTGEAKHYDIEHISSHFAIEPSSRLGFYNTILQTINWYCDNNTTYSYSSYDVPLNGEIVAYKRMRSKETAVEFVSANSNIRITSFRSYWKSIDQAGSTIEKRMSDADVQYALSNVEMWYTRGRNQDIDKVVGVQLGGVLDATGDGVYAPGTSDFDPLKFDTTVTLASLQSVGADECKTVIVWVKCDTDIAVTIAGEEVDYTELYNDGWKCLFVELVDTNSGDLVLTTTTGHNIYIYDIRIIPSVVDVKNITAYIDDVISNSGNNYIPRY